MSPVLGLVAEMTALDVGGPRTRSRAGRDWSYPAMPVWAGVSGAATLVAVASSLVSVGAGVLVAVVGFGAVVGVADVVWRRIPNAVCVSMAVLAVGFGLVFDSVLLSSVAIGALGTCAPVLVFHLINPTWVGFGDVKYLAALGALLGVLYWPAGMVVLWVASVAAVLSRPWVPSAWRRAVPLGFWLSVASVPVVVVVLVVQ